MDFFDRQIHEKRKTRLLVILFGLAVLFVVICLNLILGGMAFVLFHPVGSDSTHWNPLNFLVSALFLFGEVLVNPAHAARLLWHPQLAGWVTIFTLISILSGCIYKRRILSSGSVVAELLGGRKVGENASDADETKLCNVIEEMAVASQLPVPEIYLLVRERGINTFAAGHTNEDVAIGVTAGCVKLLSRDELQGVIAHEFSHVLNGDTCFNMELMALVHGLFWPTLVGRLLTRGTTDESVNNESIFDQDAESRLLPTAPLGFLFLVIGSVSILPVRILKSAICRNREWLADAAAVQFTRNPAGIEGALKKIGGLLKQGRLDTPYAEVASHLYFVNCDLDPWFDFQSTHPPLEKRILAIDPAFDGSFQHIKSLPRPEIVEAARYDKLYEASLQRAREQDRLREELE